MIQIHFKIQVAGLFPFFHVQNFVCPQTVICISKWQFICATVHALYHKKIRSWRSIQKHVYTNTQNFQMLPNLCTPNCGHLFQDCLKMWFSRYFFKIVLQLNWELKSSFVGYLSTYIMTPSEKIRWLVKTKTKESKNKLLKPTFLLQGREKHLQINCKTLLDLKILLIK